ncbi:unnamed protein product [Cyclocybe aegerita]|uniref:Uncharacterized protein n=1 Tax=Cyclocybe aegerita TaxID=1973307 RepID=A0A8S0VZR9_CYCAE|nr:unnamed protein product [Cyclocybe aegerita]
MPRPFSAHFTPSPPSTPVQQCLRCMSISPLRSILGALYLLPRHPAARTPPYVDMPGTCAPSFILRPRLCLSREPDLVDRAASCKSPFCIWWQVGIDWRREPDPVDRGFQSTPLPPLLYSGRGPFLRWDHPLMEPLQAGARRGPPPHALKGEDWTAVVAAATGALDRADLLLHNPPKRMR